MAIKEVRPRVLTLDIETAPLEVYAWGTYDQNIGLNMIKKDRSILSWAAKLLGADKVYYADVRGQKDLRDDRSVVKKLLNLLNTADVLVTQNGKKFDLPIIKGRLAVHGLQPPKPTKHIDTCLLARKLGFTSNKLEYLSNTLNDKYKKLDHGRFAGFTLWQQCLAGNVKAWREMEKYNKHDVLATEELYTKLAPFGTGVNFDLYRESNEVVCNCGSTKFRRKGYAYTPSGKFQIHQCLNEKCGAWFRSSENLLSKEKRLSLRKMA